MSKSEKKTEKKTEKTKKSKPDKYNGFKVPSKTGPKQTKCVVHIYNMIKEANPLLLDNPDVKKTFNDFVDCLLKYDMIESHTSAYDKSSNGINSSNGIRLVEHTKELCTQNLKRLNCKFNYEYTGLKGELKTKMIEDSFDIVNCYVPLYELIKRDVVPHMELKNWKVKSKKDIEFYHKLIEREEAIIKNYEASINASRQNMCSYAERALALQNPPELTTF